MRCWPATFEQRFSAGRLQPGRLLLNAGGFAAALLSISALGGEVFPEHPGKRLASVADAELERPDARTDTVVVSFFAEVVGYRGERLEACWALLEVQADRLPARKRSDGCFAAITPKADAESFIDQVTVQVPRGKGLWIIRVTICHQGRPLARDLTRVFPVEPASSKTGSGLDRGEHIAGGLRGQLRRRLARRGDSRGVVVSVGGSGSDAPRIGVDRQAGARRDPVISSQGRRGGRTSGL